MSNQSSGANESIKKRNKKTKDSDSGSSETLTKDEQQIARFLRLSCPNRQGNLLGMKVDFFVANKLIECLMSSKWGPGTGISKEKSASTKQPYLANKQACIAFMQRLMNKQLFYRAIKIYKEQAEPSSPANSSETPNLKKRKTNKENSGQTPTSGKDQKESQAKRKFKLEMHEDQKFIDANEPYVWVYDPTSTKTYVIGSLLILGAIGICLFPLWPSQVREGVYYVSLAGASFLGAILGLAVFKYVLFGFVWACTFGSVQFWLFPNLTEDVGFLESFVPVYKTNCSSSTKAVKQDEAEPVEEASDHVKDGEIKDDDKDMTSSTISRKRALIL